MKNLVECVVLYVEDDDATAYLFQMALRRSDLAPQLFRVTNGEDASAFLFKTGVYSNAPKPDLVLLDLNLPRKSGFDVLAQIKDHASLRNVTVVVFSSSSLPYDRERSMLLGADDYLQKGSDFDAFVAAAETVCRMLTTDGLDAGQPNTFGGWIPELDER